MDGFKFEYVFTKPDGRINRKPWWIAMGILFAISLVAAALLGDDGLLASVSNILILVAGIMAHIKRCHDRGKSGWWCLIILIPVVGLVWAIVDLGVLEGDTGPNAYGPDPLSDGIA